MADLLRIQEEAKDRGFDSAKFWLSTPTGVHRAEWLDAYFGFFKLPKAGDGFFSVSDFPSFVEGFWEKSEAEKHNKETFQ